MLMHADSSFVPPLIYSVLGSSRHLAVGPVSIASLVMGTMLHEAASAEEQPALYLQLAFTATFFAGLFQASLGFLRLKIFFTCNNSSISFNDLRGFLAKMMMLCIGQELRVFCPKFFLKFEKISVVCYDLLQE